MNAIIELHCGPEFTKHIGRSVEIIRANNNGDHVVVEYTVDGVKCVACYSFGWSIRRYGSQFSVRGGANSFSTIRQAAAWCRLRSEGRPNDTATFIDAVAA